MRRRYWSLSGVLPIVAVALFDKNLPYMILGHANRPVLDRPAIFQQFQVPSEVARFPSRDGLQIASWFIPAAQKGGRTVIVLHGLDGTREDMLSFALPLQQRGMNLLMLDLLGQNSNAQLSKVKGDDGFCNRLSSDHESCLSIR